MLAALRQPMGLQRDNPVAFLVEDGKVVWVPAESNQEAALPLLPDDGVAMRRNGMMNLLKDSLVAWAQSDAATHAAALAYFAIFSMAPLLIICMAIATQVFSQAAVEVFQSRRASLNQAIRTFQERVRNSTTPSAGSSSP